MSRAKPDVDHDAGFKKAAYEQVNEDQLAREFGAAIPTQGVPTSLSSGDGHHHLQMAPTQIIAPDGDQVANYGIQGVAVCGHCKFFDLESGRKEIVRQKFGQKVVRDYEWKLKHLGDVDALGLCGASGGETATQFISRACDQFRPAK